MATLDTELQCLTTRTRSVEASVQRDTELLQQLDDFLQVKHKPVVDEVFRYFTNNSKNTSNR